MASGQLSYAQIMGLWQHAGGGNADIAAAIACAESSRYPGVIQQDQPYAATGWGLWQITPGDALPQFGKDYQMLNPFANARAAVHYWHTRGFEPWTTYNDEAYRRFLQRDEKVTLHGLADAEYDPIGHAPRATHNHPHLPHRQAS